mmetsp:Transcript_14899/g.46944  ORF Transcript_14899/g.46944 Transcript_14899/m.46944 type:complete len:203 (-) Transcript_14899:329-937(-)
MKRRAICSPRPCGSASGKGLSASWMQCHLTATPDPKGGKPSSRQRTGSSSGGPRSEVAQVYSSMTRGPSKDQVGTPSSPSTGGGMAKACWRLKSSKLGASPTSPGLPQGPPSRRCRGTRRKLQEPRQCGGLRRRRTVTALSDMASARRMRRDNGMRASATLDVSMVSRLPASENGSRTVSFEPQGACWSARFSSTTVMVRVV